MRQLEISAFTFIFFNNTDELLLLMPKDVAYNLPREGASDDVKIMGFLFIYAYLSSLISYSFDIV